MIGQLSNGHWWLLLTSSFRDQTVNSWFRQSAWIGIAHSYSLPSSGLKFLKTWIRQGREWDNRRTNNYYLLSRKFVQIMVPNNSFYERNANDTLGQNILNCNDSMVKSPCLVTTPKPNFVLIENVAAALL